MKKLITGSLVACMILGCADIAAAQPYRDHNHYGSTAYPGHNQGWNNHWRRGGRIDRGQWSHYNRVDWRARHLRAPPRGYEWREVDGRYVLAAVATGLIADIIINSQ